MVAVFFIGGEEMNKIQLIEEYLVKHIDKLDFVVDDVLFLVPDSYFYTPEIHQREFSMVREELNMLIRKKNFSAYRSDKNIAYQYKKLLKKYNASLLTLAVKKRSELREELLAETDEMKCACLITLIKKYNLLSRLRAYE